jgi:hypothetical protein
MKSVNLRLAAFGAILVLAGAAHAQSFDYYPETWTHGSACTGTGIVQSAYGPYNPSTSTPVTITCPIASAWSYRLAGAPRFIDVSYYNRNPNPGAFSCKVYGLDGGGNIVWNSGTVAFPTGAPGSGLRNINIGQPPDEPRSFMMTCTLPPNSGGSGGLSHLTQIGILVEGDD